MSEGSCPCCFLCPVPQGGGSPRPHPRGSLRPPWPRIQPWSLGPVPSGSDGNTQKCRISWESLQGTQPVQLSPEEKCPRGSAMTIPVKSRDRTGGTAMATAGSGWMDSGSEPGSCRTGSGEIYSFSRGSPKVSPWLTLPAFPFPCNRDWDFERNNVTKGSSGAKAIPDPWVCVSLGWISLVPLAPSPRDALGTRGLLLPCPSASGLQGVRDWGNETPRLALPHQGLKLLCPSSCHVSWSLLPPRAEPWQGHVWIPQKSLDLGKTEHKQTRRSVGNGS